MIDNFISIGPHRPYTVGKLSIRQVRMWNFTRIGPKTNKLWLSIIPAQTPSEQPGLGPPPKGVNCNFSSAKFDKPYGVRKLSISDVYICSFIMIGQKIKNYSSFNFLTENLENFRLTELYGVPLEGSTIFLYRSSFGSTSLKSCPLPELKYAIFSTTVHKTKKLPRSLFLSTVFKHGLPEGSTILLQYSAITCTLLESSRLSELKYAISAG